MSLYVLQTPDALIACWSAREAADLWLDALRVWPWHDVALHPVAPATEAAS